MNTDLGKNYFSQNADFLDITAIGYDLKSQLIFISESDAQSIRCAASGGGQHEKIFTEGRVVLVPDSNAQLRSK